MGWNQVVEFKFPCPSNCNNKIIHQHIGIGSIKIQTRGLGFKVQCRNHYTIEPNKLLKRHVILIRRLILTFRKVFFESEGRCE